MARTAALVLGGVLVLVLALRLTVWSDPAPESATPAAPFLGTLRVGDAAPAFVLQGQDGQSVRVGGPSSRWTIVSFFRQALSPW